jgi:hypothetical protein
VDEEEIEDVSIDLSSSDEKSTNGGEDVDNGDMRACRCGGCRVGP